MDTAALIGSYIGLLVLGLIFITLWVKIFRGDFEDNKFLIVGLNIFVMIGVYKPTLYFTPETKWISFDWLAIGLFCKDTIMYRIF